MDEAFEETKEELMKEMSAHRDKYVALFDGFMKDIKKAETEEDLEVAVVRNNIRMKKVLEEE